MARVAGARPSTASSAEADAGRAPKLKIRKIDVADVVECVQEGVRDFTRAPIYGMFFGGVYACGGLLILWGAFSLGYYYLAYPVVIGFALLAPFAAAGTYEISRRLEAGEPLSWSAVLGAVWRRSGKDLGWLALVSLFTFIIWLDVAVFVFLMFYGMDVPTFEQMFARIFNTTHGLTFLIVGNAIGAIIGLVVFAFAAVSPPLLVDRDIDFVTAMSTSVRAVIANPRAMLAWAVVIGAGLAFSFITLFVALLVIFPILGHATWRLYRKLIV